MPIFRRASRPNYRGWADSTVPRIAAAETRGELSAIQTIAGIQDLGIRKESHDADMRESSFRVRSGIQRLEMEKEKHAATLVEAKVRTDIMSLEKQRKEILWSEERLKTMMQAEQAANEAEIASNESKVRALERNARKIKAEEYVEERYGSKLRRAVGSGVVRNLVDVLDEVEADPVADDLDPSIYAGYMSHLNEHQTDQANALRQEARQRRSEIEEEIAIARAKRHADLDKTIGGFSPEELSPIKGNKRQKAAIAMHHEFSAMLDALINHPDKDFMASEIDLAKNLSSYYKRIGQYHQLSFMEKMRSGFNPGGMLFDKRAMEISSEIEKSLKLLDTKDATKRQSAAHGLLAKMNEIRDEVVPENVRKAIKEARRQAAEGRRLRVAILRERASDPLPARRGINESGSAIKSYNTKEELLQAYDAGLVREGEEVSVAGSRFTLER